MSAEIFQFKAPDSESEKDARAVRIDNAIRDQLRALLEDPRPLTGIMIAYDYGGKIGGTAYVIEPGNLLMMAKIVERVADQTFWDLTSA